MSAARTLSWIGTALCAAAIFEIGSYIQGSNSNHTSFEPWLLLVVFVPTTIFGVAALRAKPRLAGVFAILIGIAGIAILAYIDATNTMVQYDRWLQRGMPGHHQPSVHSNVR